MNYTVKHLKILLFLVALHSFFVGLGLIFIPSHFFVEIGYHQICENFFRAQGGVFHLVMVVAYSFAALNPIVNKPMVKFSIIAKFIATFFLIFYFLFVENIIVVLLSGLGDFAMGGLILFLAKRIGLFNAGN